MSTSSRGDWREQVAIATGLEGTSAGPQLPMNGTAEGPNSKRFGRPSATCLTGHNATGTVSVTSVRTPGDLSLALYARFPVLLLVPVAYQAEVSDPGGGVGQVAFWLFGRPRG